MRIRPVNKFLRIFLSEDTSITLAPFGIYMTKMSISNTTPLNHEKIHWKQQIEMLIIPFYIWCVAEWLIKIPKYGAKAYFEISFEREAYKHQKELNYLKVRRPYSWIRYL